MGVCSSCIPQSSRSVESIGSIEPVVRRDVSSLQYRKRPTQSSSGHEAATQLARNPSNRIRTADEFGISPPDKQRYHAGYSKNGLRAYRSMSEGCIGGELPSGSRLPRRLKRYANHIYEHSQRIRRKYKRKLRAQRIRKQKPTLGPLYAPVESLNVLREASKEHDSSSSLGSAVRSLDRKSSSMHSTRTSKTNGRRAAIKDPPAALVVSEDGSFEYQETSDGLDGHEAESSGSGSGAFWRRRIRYSPTSARKKLSRGLAEVSEDGDEIVDDEDEDEQSSRSGESETEPEPVAMSALEARSSGSLSPAHETSRVVPTSRRDRALSMESGLDYLTVFERQTHLRYRGRGGMPAESDIIRHSSVPLKSALAAAPRVHATVSTLDAVPLALPSGRISTQAGSTHSLQADGSLTSLAPSHTGSQSQGRGGRKMPAASVAHRVEAARSQASSQRQSLSGSEGDSGSMTASGSLVVPQLALLSPKAAPPAGAAVSTSTVPQ